MAGDGHSLGWLPDYSDIRDYTLHHEAILPLMKKFKVLTFHRTGSTPGYPAGLRGLAAVVLTH